MNGLFQPCRRLSTATPRGGYVVGRGPPMTTLDLLAARLRAELGADRVVTDRQELRTYECDGLAHYKVIPGLVVLPRDAAECAATVRACARAGVPFVARGSGTGLSGGALPHAEGVLIVTSRMRAVV